MSGYASENSTDTKIDRKWKLLNKPFTREQLANALLSTLS
jgi:hypothetical protein